MRFVLICFLVSSSVMLESEYEDSDTEKLTELSLSSIGEPSSGDMPSDLDLGVKACFLGVLCDNRRPGVFDVHLD